MNEAGVLYEQHDLLERFFALFGYLPLVTYALRNEIALGLHWIFSHVVSRSRTGVLNGLG